MKLPETWKHLIKVLRKDDWLDVGLALVIATGLGYLMLAYFDLITP